MMRIQGADIFQELKADILRLQGHKPANNPAVDLGLGPVTEAFENQSFPLGAVHEFVTARLEDTAATSAFITGMLSPLLACTGTAMWISASRKLFPPALKGFGVPPHRFVFIDLKNEKDVMWSMEEALRCSALTAVVGEMHDLSFTASRRLQLAVEQSRVTGFVIRRALDRLQTTACVSRWKITTVNSTPVDGLPGVGFPQWKVELLRVRNGRTGSWNLRWADGKFNVVGKASVANHHNGITSFMGDEKSLELDKAG